MKARALLAAILALITLCAVFAGCSDSSSGKYVILEEDFGAEEYAIGFRPEDVDLATRVQEILDEIYADGTGAEIASKWFGSDVILKGNDFASDMSGKSAGDGSLDYIINKGTFIVGLDDSYPPMGYRDDNGEIIGFDIDLAAAVCEKLGVKLELVPIDWNAKDMELSSKNIDVIWNGMSVTAERKVSYLLSKPYLANAQIILVAEDSGIKTKADLAGKNVGTQVASAALDALQSEENQAVTSTFASLNEYADYNTAFLDLKAGRIDALVGDKTFIEYILANQD